MRTSILLALVAVSFTAVLAAPAPNHGKRIIKYVFFEITEEGHKN